MKKLLFIIIIVSFSFNSFCQTKNDTITIYKNKYSLNGKSLTPKQMMILFKDYPDAYNEMKIAKNNFDCATALSYISGFCIGYPLGQFLAGGEPTWAMAGVGVGLIFIEIPLASAYNKHTKSAIKLYNSKITGISSLKYNFYFGMTSYGVGITFKL
jgi:hypothetical protein